MQLRQSGLRIGLARPCLLRPFPAQAFIAALAGKKAAAVIDQNISLGKGGVLHGEIASALYGVKGAPPILASFIGGLGGRDISQEEFFRIAEILVEAGESGITPPPRLLYTETEFAELKKLRAIAHYERRELHHQQQ
jgi:pyruvate ferredoxin oxidoreductase alpha subunit